MYIGQLAFLPNIQYSKKVNCNSNLKIRATWKVRMLSMDWDAFDVIRKKNSRRRHNFHSGVALSARSE